jgi:putative spermidine/putrescine transport system permease protein
MSGSGAVTLPRRMWDDVLYQIEPTIAAISTLTIVLTAVLMGCAHLLRKRAPLTLAKPRGRRYS